MIRQFSRHVPEESHPSTGASSHSTRLRTFISFVDEKEEVYKSKSKRKREDALSNSHVKEDETRNSSKRSQMGSSQQRHESEIWIN